MKPFARLKPAALIPVVIFLLLLPAPAPAQDAPVQITLVADKAEYIQGDPIMIQIRVFNDNTNPGTGMVEPVITREGFFAQDFRLKITFIGPDGKPIKNRYETIDPEPGPPYRFGGRDTVPAEIIPPDGQNNYLLDDAHAIYDLLQPGWYTAQVLVPFESFSEYGTDEAGGLLAYLDDPGRQAFDPLASNQIRFEIKAPEPGVNSEVQAKVSLLKIGGGTKPGATKTPVRYAPVNLIRMADIPPDYYPVNWKTYDVIWQNVPPLRTKLTDSDGIARFSGVAQDDYLILAQPEVATDFKHLGSPVEATDDNWLTDQPIVKHLMVMEKANKTKVPGKTKKVKGSELLITEPEYIQWESSQETYPFVFESIGDWQVETAVTPPEGFTADYKALEAQVTNEIEAVQFTVTDVGSSWKETGVKFKIKHKGKKKTIQDKIGVKLSKKLTKLKGVGSFGETEVPGPFTGGKKIGHDKHNSDKKKK